MNLFNMMKTTIKNHIEDLHADAMHIAGKRHSNKKVGLQNLTKM